MGTPSRVSQALARGAMVVDLVTGAAPGKRASIRSRLHSGAIACGPHGLSAPFRQAWGTQAETHRSFWRASVNAD